MMFELQMKKHLKQTEFNLPELPPSIGVCKFKCQLLNLNVDWCLTQLHIANKNKTSGS